MLTYRTTDPAAAQGDLIAAILASRGVETADARAFLSPPAASLASPWLLAGMRDATRRIASAMVGTGSLVLAPDYDADGQTSHAVVRHALSRFGLPVFRLHTVFSSRLTEGYGLNQAVAERIEELARGSMRPELVITMDSGSSDGARISWLLEHGIETVVTDHHDLPDTGIPEHAAAVVNPQQAGCAYPEKGIAGCMVAWYTMVALRSHLIKAGVIPAETPPLDDLLDFVAVGTVADCVSLTTPANRIAVRLGLERINTGSRPCWQALLEHKGGPIQSEDLGFLVGPLLNAASRVADVDLGTRFLFANTLPAAQEALKELVDANTQRKTIERAITERAVMTALVQAERGAAGVSVFHPDFHPGVVGICASRVKERTGCPAVVFAPHGEGSTITGSARGVDYAPFHVREAFQGIADRHPGLLVKFGGHSGAGGCTIERARMPLFAEAWDAEVRAQIPAPTPTVLMDLPLDGRRITLKDVEAIDRMGPFGRGWTRPTFGVDVSILSVNPIGAGGVHLKVRARASATGQPLDAVWFNARASASEILPVLPRQHYRLAVELAANEYRGNTSLQLMIRAAEPQLLQPADLPALDEGQATDLPDLGA